MATLTPAFRRDSGKIHSEHVAILAELDTLERALDHLVPRPQSQLEEEAPSEVLAIGKKLIRELPEHCRQEEEKLHGPVGEVSPELARFCASMQREHEVMSARLWSLAAALEGFQTATNLPAAAAHLQEAGRVFIREVRRHIELEENELSGFL